MRALAKAAGLCTAEKRESMGICFVGKRRYVLLYVYTIGRRGHGNGCGWRARPSTVGPPPLPINQINEINQPPDDRLGSFLPEYMEPKAGRFVSVEDGRVLGEGGNAMFLTVGQGAKVRERRVALMWWFAVG